ncbi:MAG: coenzyme F420-0:L-glutamate ligase [Candidatus Binataceae bacterium]|nr:coenzyme F420-0:L-glutamate ligase [Candidatus Binataceae bacterium]
MDSLTLFAIEGIPQIGPGDDLPQAIFEAAQRCCAVFEQGDILAVCQKIVSKSEGRVRELHQVEPSALARNFAAHFDKDARAVELVLQQATRIVRMDRGVLIVETGPGWVCANAGMDESNSMADDRAILLPIDPDASAARLRDGILKLAGVDVAVVITDTFGRPWREGQTEVCLGIAGMNPMLDLRGSRDMGGRELHHTVLAIADEIASAAGLLMRKDAGLPAVIVRGYHHQPYDGSARALIRAAETDLFR